jgi:hypothetical protein
MIIVSAAAVVGVAGSIAAARAPEENLARNASGPIYYPSQQAADAAITRFDHENPECQLWTNWQKMCSRTGPNGETVCVPDRSHPARASEPFCAATPFAGAPSPPNPRQLSSIFRYCQRRYRERITDATGRVIFDGFLCGHYRRERPFNGRTLDARRHPYCQRWERGPAGVLVCTRWGEGGCQLLDGVPRVTWDLPDNQIVIPHVFDAERYPVMGVTCSASRRPR